MTRSLRAAAAVALIAGVMGCTPAAFARAVTRTVRYHGYALRVPSSWPVFRLDRDPAVCVRFDRHAVYLGTPGADQRCPAHAAGRTEAVLVTPLAAGAARAGTAAATRQPAGRSLRFVDRRHGVVVLATWGADRNAIGRVLDRRVAARPSTAPAGAGATTRARARVAGGPIAHTASVYTGLGFDPCSAPSSNVMSAWLSSPYRAIGVYLGGANSACAQPNLTASWVRQQAAIGWHLIPTYVGLQSPSSSCGCATIQPGHAAAEGVAAAQDAIVQAQSLGIGSGNPIYFDMEAYSRGGSATVMVLNFLSAWTTTLHSAGYVSGVYSSAASGITDLVRNVGTSFVEPDDIWIADWNGAQTTSDPYVPAADWPSHQRLHQYNGGANATYGGYTLNIDGDYLDGATTGARSASPFPDGTFIQDQSTLNVYEIAGGAPLFVSSWDAVGGPQPVTSVTPGLLASLNQAPANGTFLVTSTGRMFRVAGGAPIAISSWSVFGGVRAHVNIDEWDLDNITDPLAHLRTAPADGTVVEGIPSRTYWLFTNGARSATGITNGAVAVDDAGLATFNVIPPPTGGSSIAVQAYCVVPKLGHLTLTQAKGALKRAHCALGRVAKPRHVKRHHVLRVVAQSARARSRHPLSFAVAVTLR